MSEDLSDAVEECSVDVLITRSLSVSVSDGRKSSPRTEDLPWRASVTPITGQDLKRLGLGQLVSGTMLIITGKELFTAQSSPCKLADVMTYKGIRYQIGVVNDWDDLGGFYECVGTRLDR